MYDLPERRWQLMQAIKINTELEIEVIEVYEPLHISIRQNLGGYLEVVKPKKLNSSLCMIVDEEGLIKGLPFNPWGCWLYGTEEHMQPIAGDIIIMAEMDSIDGIVLKGLTDEQMVEIIEQANKFIKSFKTAEYKVKSDFEEVIKQ